MKNRPRSTLGNSKLAVTQIMGGFSLEKVPWKKDGMDYHKVYPMFLALLLLQKSSVGMSTPVNSQAPATLAIQFPP